MKVPIKYFSYSYLFYCKIVLYQNSLLVRKEFDKSNYCINKTVNVTLSFCSYVAVVCNEA